MQRPLLCFSLATLLGSVPAAMSLGAELDRPLKLPSPVAWNERPAIAAAPDGAIWLAWVGFHEGVDDIIVVRSRSGSAEVVTRLGAPKADDFSPGICVDSAGHVHVVWVGRRDGGFRVLHAGFADGKWSPERIISGKQDKCLGPAVAASSDGQVCAAWEAIDAGNTDIHAATLADGKWTAPARLTSAAEADCNPALAAGKGGAVWLAWDRCEELGYRIQVALLSANAISREQTLDFGDGHFRHPELATDGDRLWVGCEGFRALAEPTGRARMNLDQWYGYLPACRLVKSWDGSQWSSLPDDPQQSGGMRVRPLVGAGGEVWVFFEGKPTRNAQPRAKVLSGGEWKKAFDVSAGLLSWEHRPAVCAAGGEVWAAFPSNTRDKSPDYAFTIAPGDSYIHLVRLTAPSDPSPSAEEEPAPPLKIVRDARPPLRTIESAGQTLNLYFGDLHKHSDISGCGVLDGTTLDNYRFWRDWRRLDFMMNADHSEHHDDYDWVKVRRAAELFSDEGHFAGFSGYEWTSEFNSRGNLRCGHYNPTFLTDGPNLPCLSASKPESNDPDKLWARLRESLLPGDDVITVCHHTGRENAPLDWSYYDPDYASHIEVVQSRGSYEHWNCPDQEKRMGDTTRARGHFVQDGLARGYAYGFTGGGDHSGWAVTGVFASARTKAEIFRALKAKRCYATNGERIFLDFRVDGRLMGSDFESDSGSHKIMVHAAAPSKIERVDLWRDGRIVQSEIPRERECLLVWPDDSGRFRRSYYYARVITETGGIAWASPVWITHRRAAPTVRIFIDSQQAEVACPEMPLEFPVVLRNDGDRDAAVKPALDLPKGWEAKMSPSADVSVKAGGWVETRMRVTPDGSPEGGAKLETVHVRLEPDGSSLDAPEVLVLHLPSGVDDAARTRDLCKALHGMPAEKRAEHLADQDWLRTSVERFGQQFLCAWQVSAPVAREGAAETDKAVEAAAGQAAGLPDLGWQPCLVELYLDDDRKLKHSVPLAKPRPGGEEEAWSYCVTYVYSPSAREAKLDGSADAAYDLWLNGRSIEKSANRKRAKTSGGGPSVELKPGWNQIALRIDRGRLFARFWMRVTAPDGEPLTDLKFAASPG